jgi:hypothetical protein
LIITLALPPPLGAWRVPAVLPDPRRGVLLVTAATLDDADILAALDFTPEPARCECRGCSAEDYDLANCQAPHDNS